MEISVKTFDELTIHELYDILQLRSEVFVVEQDCVYQDLDGKDQKALHIIGKNEGKLVAYTRCFAPGIYFDEVAIGRVVVPMGQRKYGYGHDIMKASLAAIKDRFNQNNVALSAQEHLKKFYETHGFVQKGKGYLEDGIPHIFMVRS